MYLTADCRLSTADCRPTLGGWPRIALPYLEGFLFLLICIASCKSDPSTPPQPSDPLRGAEEDLRVVVKLGRLRDTPAPSGHMLHQLQPGQRLKDLGEVSDHTTQILYGTEKFDEPWLKVALADGQSGWIYGREVAPVNEQADLEDFRHRKYLRSICGETGYKKLLDFQQAWQDAGTAARVAEAYRQGLNLRDSLLPRLEHKSYSYTDQALPDLFWIGNHIPGFVPQLVAEGTVYHLFSDYGQWLEKAKTSTDQQDDRFFSLLARCFPQDSIEYFFPAWEVQTWDYGGHNLLGKGIVYEILAGIEQILPKTPLFSNELLQLKNQILNSITQPNVHFWEADSLVRRELDQIIQSNWRIFAPTDRIALETRRQQLDSAAVYQIRFDARAGGE